MRLKGCATHIFFECNKKDCDYMEPTHLTLGLAHKHMLKFNIYVVFTFILPVAMSICVSACATTGLCILPGFSLICMYYC